MATTVANRDIDTAAKFIGAGAVTVGVAGSVAGKYSTLDSLHKNSSVQEVKLKNQIHY